MRSLAEICLCPQFPSTFIKYLEDGLLNMQMTVGRWTVSGRVWILKGSQSFGLKMDSVTWYKKFKTSFSEVMRWILTGRKGLNSQEFSRKKSAGFSSFQSEHERILSSSYCERKISVPLGTPVQGVLSLVNRQATSAAVCRARKSGINHILSMQ